MACDHTGEAYRKEKEEEAYGAADDGSDHGVADGASVQDGEGTEAEVPIRGAYEGKATGEEGHDDRAEEEHRKAYAEEEGEQERDGRAEEGARDASGVEVHDDTEGQEHAYAEEEAHDASGEQEHDAYAEERAHGGAEEQAHEDAEGVERDARPTAGAREVAAGDRETPCTQAKASRRGGRQAEERGGPWLATWDGGAGEEPCARSAEEERNACAEEEEHSAGPATGARPVDAGGKVTPCTLAKEHRIRTRQRLLLKQWRLL